MRPSNHKEQILWIFLIVLAAIFIGFFFPFSLSPGFNLLFKGVLFIGIFMALYYFWFSPVRPYRSSNAADEDESEEIKPNGADEAPQGFANASECFHHQFLHIVRTSVVASTAGLYFRKGEHAVELMAADCDSDTPHPRCLIEEESLLDTVIARKSAVSEGHLPQGFVLPGIEDIEISSFAAVPLHLEEKLIGVLVVGSEAEDHFGDEDLAFLDRCGRLVGQVTSMYHLGWRKEIQEQLRLNQLELENALQNAQTEREAFDVFAEHVQKIFPFHRLTLCIRDGDEGVVRYVFGQLDKLGEGTRFPLDEGLMGWILKRNAPLMIADMQEGNYVRPRYFQGEESKHGLRSLLGLPFFQGEAAWACIALESHLPYQYHEREKQAFINVVRYFESLLIQFQLRNQLIKQKQ